jgi:predicted RNase H-like nuclease (RuvC/YqgF family)
MLNFKGAITYYLSSTPTDMRKGREGLSDPIAAARNFIRSALPLRSSKNSLERIPQAIEQYKEKNASLAKDIPLLKEIANKQWKKEDELKGLKSELAAIDRKIQLELAKDKEPQQQQAVANGDEVVEDHIKSHF